MSIFHKKTITSEEQHRRMLTTPMPKLITAMAIPTTLSQLVSVIYNTADTYFVSQISTSASAAVGAAFSLMSIIQAIGYGFAMGAGSLISRNLGAKKDEEAEKYAVSAVAAATLIGLLISVFGLLNLEGLMRLLGSTETMLPHACAYARYILIGAPFMCCAFVLSGILRSEGMADFSSIGLCSGGILNMLLDPMFIFGLDMGTAGAALATILSQFVSLIILASAFVTKKSIVSIRLKRISGKLKDYWLIFTTGLPTICRQGLASFASAELNIHAAVYGDAVVAAITIANKVYLLVRNVVVGIGQGFVPVAGYNYGAGDKERTREAFWFTTAVGTVICFIAAGICGCCAPDIIGWFRDDPEVIEYGRKALLYASAVMPFMGLSTYVNQLYQALGFKLPASILASCRQGICFLPLILLLPKYLGVTGVQMTQPGADLLTFFVAVPFLIVFMRRYLKEN